MNTSECLKIFVGHSGVVCNVKFLNENQIVTCSDDKTIKIWDIATGECIKTFLGHSELVRRILILSCGRKVRLSNKQNNVTLLEY